MTLTQELRHPYQDLWHRMVTHPFVIEMGEGTLPVAKFRAYFLQDYVFVHDLVAMTSMGLAKAATFLAANQLHQFLAGILSPDRIFHTALRYEYLFWEGAYHGSAHWPDQRAG